MTSSPPGTETPEPADGASASPDGGGPSASRWRRRPSRTMIALVTVPLIGFVVLAYAGEALFPALTPDPDADDPGRPLALILLTPSLRNFTLVSTSLDPWSYYGLGVARVLLSDPFYYLLGFWFGHSAITWMERRTRTWGTMLRQLEQGFERYGYLALFALPYNFMPLLAGAARLPLWRVLVVRGVGIATRIFLVRQLGMRFEGGLDNLLGWIAEYRIPLLVVSFALVIVSILLELKKKGETQVSSLAHLEEEIDEIDEKVDTINPRLDETRRGRRTTDD